MEQRGPGGIAVVDKAGGPRRPYKRSMRNYLINRRFQLKWIGAILVLTALVFGTLGYYIYWFEKNASEQLMASMSESTAIGPIEGYDSEDMAIMDTLLTESDSNVLWVLLGAGSTLVLLLAGIGIVLTHKIAGPIYALGRSMESVAGGNWRSVRGVREGDEFQELAAQWCDLVGGLREKELREVEALEQVAASSGMPEVARNAIVRLAVEKRAYLE